MFLQSAECGTNVYFRLCLSNKASWRFSKSGFVAMLHVQFAYYVTDANLLRAKRYIEMSLEFKVNEQFNYDSDL